LIVNFQVCIKKFTFIYQSIAMNQLKSLMKTFFTIASVMALAIISCQKPINRTDPAPNPNPNPNPNPTTEVQVNDNEMVTASVRGIVVNENNVPVQGATVKSGVNTTTTDRYGIFRFSNISLSKANGTVKVEQNGYFNAFRTFVSTAGRIHDVRIQLLPKTNAGNFVGASGGTINITGGGKLIIPAAAVTDAGGAAYNGTVNVAMTWIDPTATNLSSILMGDLRGVTTGGFERGLSTYGMLGVELTGTGGQALKIATGKTAELTFPIPASLSSSAPATIDLWHFDEATARWKQEGTATKTGSNYVANVSHFSFWNCDAPFPLIDLCMTLLKGPENGPLVNAQVRIKRTINGSYGYGRTDSLGRLCGKVPKDEALVIEVVDQCNTVAFSQNIGPYNANADLGTVTVTIPTTNSLTITGTIKNCSNANVTSGAAVIYVTGGYNYSAPVTNGAFSLTIVRCAIGTVNFSVLGVDYTALQQSGPVAGSGTTGTVNVGTIQACGTSSVEYAEFLLDGNPVSFTAPPDSLMSFVQSATRSVYANRAGTSGSGPAASFSYTDITSPGTAPLLNCFISSTSNVSQQIITTSPIVNITAVGPPMTGFIEGNFNVQMNFSGTPKTVACTFRVRRN